MDRRNFLRGFGIGAAFAAVPMAVVAASKEDKSEVLDKLSVNEEGQIFVQGGVVTDGDLICGAVPNNRVVITAPKIKGDNIARIYVNSPEI